MTTSHQVFRFRYRLTLADFIALNDARNRLGVFGRYLWPARYLVWYALMLFFLWLFGGLTRGWRIFLTWDVGKWFLPVLALPPVIDLLYNRVILRWYFHAQAVSKADTAVDIGDEGVAWTLDHSAGRIGWPGIRYHVFREDRIILFIDKMQGITLPRSGLVAGHWDGLVALVRRKAEETRTP